MARTQARCCDGKAGYSTRERAQQGLERMAAETGAYIPAFRIYLCKFCTRYHFAHLRKQAWERLCRERR